MEDRVGEFYFQNGIRNNFTENKPDPGKSEHILYEVLRVIRGVPLFMEEHLERLTDSVHALACRTETLEKQAKENLEGLILANNMQEGNVMLICALKNEAFVILTYAIPHKYPESSDYRNGVNLATCRLYRPEPNLKQVSVSDRIRDTLNRSIENENLYEVLLVNQENCITEGSKSNFFLIKGKSLYTAPDETVLKGITRKYVLKIAHRVGIECKFTNLPVESIAECDAAFICGTSSLILPVRMINEISFDSHERTIRRLMELYQKVIEDYMESRLPTPDFGLPSPDSA